MAELGSTKIYGDLEVTGSSYGIDGFKTISIAGQPDIVADNFADTLTLAAGTNVTLTSNATAESITINCAPTNIGLGTVTSTEVPLTSSTGTGTTLPEATTSLAGLLNATDKAKLNGINSVINIDATGLSTITLNPVNNDVFYITNITTGDTINIAALAVGKTLMIVLDNPGAITIDFNETILWSGGTAPVHGSGIEAITLTRVTATIVLGSASLNHS